MAVRFALLLLLALLTNNTVAQIKAVTGTGDEVVLYENHTWKYINKSDTESHEIQTNRISFEKKSNATFQVSSNIVDNANIYIDPKKWKFKKSDGSSVYEFFFTSAKKDAYGMFIGEKTQMPVTSLREIALQYATKVAPDIHVLKEEYRTVNGIQVLEMDMQGTVQGIDVTYMNYYFSSTRGTIQFDTFTGTAQFKDSKADMEELLNGLVITLK